MLTAKVFQSGRSQAVRVPKRYRFHSTEVNMQKIPDGLLLTEKSPWELFDERFKRESQSELWVHGNEYDQTNENQP